jgi:archaellum biogenesis ATPase FlaH
MAMNEWMKSGNGKTLSTGNCSFAIIDNLSTLLTYNSFNSVQIFLQNFLQTLHPSENMIIPLMIDSEKSGLLYETARTMCKVEIRMKDLLPEQLPDIRPKMTMRIDITKG